MQVYSAFTTSTLEEASDALGRIGFYLPVEGSYEKAKHGWVCIYNARFRDVCVCVVPNDGSKSPECRTKITIYGSYHREISIPPEILSQLRTQIPELVE